MTQIEEPVLTDGRPLPAPDDVSRFFWDAAAEHRLVLQRCAACEKLQYPPEVCCIHCQSENFEVVEATGRGVLYSYSVVNRPLHAGFVDALPYIVALVELDDQPGLRMITNLVDVPAGTQLTCGAPVEVVFEDRGAVTLPQFRLSGGTS
ncbi:Zn-ribbon domain-containing OB-fold protein [Mycobacterium sp. CVI_P3]|uniref:Zn-ribbon domain-containing OB-fold protein n=1 Tax=Mycobacterium pinniadriaticum TaxID=2994102 RepID=A0ABT3SQ45_9MYCO|nr:Zn-ribbon domain-containing OB-fold protein [Mycobacterium pinniadriaticum]MCX2934882.1 Zn-ribbon domain-containing OB-fold protein [Mycobacterium pinniadriaticum]MCX2941304.1 Zn-ribbon domain-containing OB-fold protein [Mycobacterium pinniadriaticum]